MLQRNVERRRLPNVRLFASAVADHDGPAQLWQTPLSIGHSLLHAKQGATEALPVASLRLDTLSRTEAIERADLVKVDVEGAEAEVLSGMSALAARSSGLALILEYKPEILRARGEDLADFLGRLAALGFTDVRALSDAAPPRRLDPGDASLRAWPKCNLLARRPGANGDACAEQAGTTQGAPTKWGRWAAALAAVAALSFAWGQLPYVVLARPWSFGADGDSALHFAIQMRLRDPRVLPNDPELDLYMAARPPLEFLIHRSVGWLSDLLFRGNLFAANMAAFWTLHLWFIAGNLKLGREALGSLGAATLFAAASAGASRSLFAWWGMPYSAVVPHSTVAMAMVPWLVWAYLRFGTHRTGRLGLFLALGLAVNLYPLYPAYLALIVLVVESIRGRRRDLSVLALVFVLAALPSVATAAWRSLTALGTLDAGERRAVQALFDQFYPYLQGGLGAPATARTLGPVSSVVVSRGRLLARTLKRRREELRETDRQLSWMAVAAVALALVGLQAAGFHRAFALFLFHRSSALVYIPAYLGCAWLAASAARTAGWSGKAAAAAVAVLMLCNAGYHAALGYAVRGDWPPQTSHRSMSSRIGRA